ncbi:hypothetical protein WJX84_001868 [Apatococcus fuscideae]|uniref:Uncharacterized protein n=1 Tax=Apatococcus fuscideae TaxID=2026836 RepID=A0AAW1T7Z9_9CHLO
MSHRRNQPAEKGWNYQGTNDQSRVDYWEKDGCKLDYYYTTGTFKTSMHHPSQGKNTQMFRRDLSDAAHGNVLDNPRYHSGAGDTTLAMTKGPGQG